MPSPPYDSAGEAPERRSPLLRIVVAFFLLMVLLVGGVAAALVINPDLARRVPGDAGARLNELALDVRGSLVALVADDGPLGGVQAFLEPYLSRLGLNLETVLVGLGLLFLVIISIRILAVTSRPDEDYDDQDVFGPEAYNPEAEGAGTRGEYWPYDQRPERGARSAPAHAGGPPEGYASRGSTPAEAAYTVPRPAEAETAAAAYPAVAPTLAPGAAGPGEPPRPDVGEFSFPEVATGDALLDDLSDESWAGTAPGKRHDGQDDEGGEPAGERPVVFPPAGDKEEVWGEGPVAGGESSAGGGESGASGPLRPDDPYYRPEVGPVDPGSGEAAPPTTSLAEERLEDMPPPSHARPGEAPGGHHSGFGAAAPQLDPYQGGGWAIPAARHTAEEPRPAPGRLDPGRPGGARGRFDTHTRPDPRGLAGPPPGEEEEGVAVRARPPLRTGLKRFTLPGFLLLVLGAGGAYGLTTPYASIVLGSPYANYILAGAAGVVGVITAVVFTAGAMKPLPRRVGPAAGRSGRPGARDRSAREGLPRQAPAETAAARSQGAAAAPRAELGAGLGGLGLEAPDACPWEELWKPSIFIPWSQNSTAVGVDVGSAWIKVVQVAPTRDGYDICNVGLCQTPPGAVAEGAIIDPEAVGAVLKELLADRGIIQRKVLAALGGQGVIIRHVQFPDMDLEELREVIRWEAEHHIPIPPPEAVVDFTVIPGPVDPDEQGGHQMRVMLVGAQRSVVENYVEAMKKAKLLPRGLDIEALADYRVLAAAGHLQDEPARYAQAIVDLGHSSTKLNIYLRGALEMTRTLGIGGETFTNVLCEQLQVTPIEAESLKRRYGVLPEGGRVLQAVTPTLQDLLFEIRRSFEFFTSRHFGQSVRQVYLVGGGSRMPGIVNALTHYLSPSLGERVPEGANVQVEIIDPLSALPLTPHLAEQAEFLGPEFVTALGLALGVEEVGHEG